MEWAVKNETGLKAVAKSLVGRLNDYKIIALYGGLGAGKTTLVKMMMDHLDCQDPVSSPTFSIINHYETSVGTIYHMDMYRLKNLSEAIDLGIEEYLESGDICIIEWPELLDPILPDPYLKVSIEVLINETRKIEV